MKEKVGVATWRTKHTPSKAGTPIPVPDNTDGGNMLSIVACFTVQSRYSRLPPGSVSVWACLSANRAFAFGYHICNTFIAVFPERLPSGVLGPSPACKAFREGDMPSLQGYRTTNLNIPGLIACGLSPARDGTLSPSAEWIVC